MSIPSNLYSEKVFAEHPISLWPLDETVDYIQLIPDADRDLTAWTDVDCDVSESALTSPALSETVYEVSSTGVLSSELTISNDSYVNQEINSLTFGFYFYPESNVESLDVGYIENEVEESTNIVISEYNSWKHISATLPLQEQSVLSLSVNILGIDEDGIEPTLMSYGSHGFSDGDKVKLDASFDMPDGLNKYHTYYIVNATENTFEIEESPGSGGIVFDVGYRYDVESEVFDTRTISFISVRDRDFLIRINHNDVSESTSHISLVSAGQLSAEFMEQSLGVIPAELSGINLPGEYYSIDAESYGLSDSPGYYLARENKLLAKNTCMPMVYGSSSLTSLSAERFGNPSFIIPGYGFLNESGRYKKYTVEFWMRVSPDTVKPRRIFGPIASSDGLYVDGPFITLKVGNSVQAHYVGEWYRPMLINIIYFRNGASLIINGEKVIDITFDSDSIDFPNKTSISGKDNDWLGFYSYSDIEQYEIDCAAVYSYRVPSAVSKRRLVYGQAIDFPDELSSSYAGESFNVDFTFAGYSNNYIYPDMVRWNSGIAENISSENNVLQPPRYSLPNIVFNNKTYDSWLKSFNTNNFAGINLKPNDSWQDTDGYVFFNTADVLQQKTAGFYCVFDQRLDFSSKETLFRLENQVTGNYLDASLVVDSNNVSDITGEIITSNSHGLLDNDIVHFVGDVPAEIIESKEYYVTYVSDDSFSIRDSKDGDVLSLSSITEDSVQVKSYSIEYNLLFNSTSETLIYKTPAITLGHTIVAGINFSQFGNYFGGNVSTLLGNKKQLQLYVGGNKNYLNTFSGTIYRIGFATERNIRSLDYLFGNNGTPFLRYQFDAGSDTSYDDEDWTGDTIDGGYAYEDYINDILSHQASYTLLVKTFFGAKYLDIATASYWQDYVPASYLAKNSYAVDGNKSYSLKFIQYNADTIIPTFFHEGTDNYDTENSLIKTYITFQLIKDGASKTEDQFTNTQDISRSKIIDPNTVDWTNTKFEVLNNSLIKLPDGISLDDLAIVVHVNMSSNGILKNPIRMRSLQLAGKSLDALLANPIKAKLGTSVYPYKKYGPYYDYDAENPYLIYKDSTPHLYLTKSSGIELTGEFSSSANRGLALPVNKIKRENYYVSSLEFSMRFTRDDLVQEPVQILEILDGSNSNEIKLWLEPSLPADQRFRLFATDQDDNELTDVALYLNGKEVTNTLISKNDWNMIGIAFDTPLDISERSGSINFVGPVIVNNISYFALNSTQQAKLNILSSPEYVGIDMSLAYAILTGTNKTIVNDGYSIYPENYRYSFITGINGQSATIKPV